MAPAATRRGQQPRSPGTLRRRAPGTGVPQSVDDRPVLFLCAHLQLLLQLFCACHLADRFRSHAHLGPSAGVRQALASPKVWMIGLFFFCALTCNYCYSFSAPAILQTATGWTVAQVGFVVAIFGLAGAVAMLIGGANSDRTGERSLHCIVPCCVMALGYLVASYARAPWLVVGSLAASFIAYNALQGPAL